MTLANVSPIAAGDCTTWIPAAVRAFILSAAVPFPPEIMAPACPMRLPGGAVRPAMNPTTGFGWLRVRLYFSKYSAASSSIEPPISPITTIPSHRGQKNEDQEEYCATHPP